MSSKDEENKTSAKKAPTYRKIIKANYDNIDFIHIFSVMNEIEFGNSFTNINALLLGCSRDTYQKIQRIKIEIYKV